VQRVGAGTASIVAHSYGTYIAGEAMLKYPEIKFDRMILCGAILRSDFPWDDVAKKEQVNAVLNQHGGQDFWAWVVAWVVSDAGQSGRYGFTSRASCLTQQRYPRFRHSDYFYDLNYTQNWLPFLEGEGIAPTSIEEGKQVNWRFRSTLIVLLVLAAALVFYFLRGFTLFPFGTKSNRALGRMNMRQAHEPKSTIGNTTRPLGISTRLFGWIRPTHPATMSAATLTPTLASTDQLSRTTTAQLS